MTEHRYAFLQPGNYARGWHILLFSSELAPGEVKPLRYFEQDFAVYRAESGRVAVLDAHCPHLGAHLASDGGRLQGDNIACPFHGWVFAPDGHCVDIPYASHIPEKAVNALRGYPVLEKNGFIALWFDPAGNPPEDYLPDIEDWGPQAWGDWRFQRSRIRAKACDVIENIVDVAHFPHVHGGIVQSFENRFKDRSVTQISRVKMSADARMVTPPGLNFDLETARSDGLGREADAWGDATYHGPSIMYYYTESRSPDMSYKSWWVNYHIPVDQDELDLCSAVIVASLDERPLPQEFLELYPITAHVAFGQDVEIWKDKVYREEPILCDGDGPINKLRKWYEQFYQPLHSD
ncbi:MAG: Rieske 2Fe-2S domain-containing protein [Pseudomonadota bacterium]